MWTHSQGVFPLRGDLAEMLGMKPELIAASTSKAPAVTATTAPTTSHVDAALLARATGGRPVQVQWMRDDEFAWEPYGSAMVMKLESAAR